jgi:endo-1,3-1,4-beta-glycanase ExoK
MKSLLLSVCLIVLLGVASAQTPTFSDDFSSGKLDFSQWTLSSGTAPGYKTGVNEAYYSQYYVDLSQHMLRLKMTQDPNPRGGVTSKGAELKSKQLFGYGTYTFVMRMASTSDHPDVPGKNLSGSTSAGWNFFNNSVTEIDIEFRGDTPSSLWLTNWINANPKKAPVLKQTDEIHVGEDLTNGFHTYVFVWAPGSVTWYLDGKQIAHHTKFVPSRPANIMLNLWGTNNVNWGGRATPNSTRYMYIKSVSFAPLGGK